MNITININAPELVQAINNLASVFGGTTMQNQELPLQQVQPQAQFQQPVQQQTQQQGYVPTPTPQTVPVQPSTIQQPTQQPTTVPTTEQSYTMDQLAVAATQLVDSGRQPEVVQLLNSFGVQALTALPKEQYGAFATQLRAMGAKI